MDINNHTSNQELSMEDQIFHDQIPVNSYYPIYTYQTHQKPFSSSSIPISTFFGDHKNHLQDYQEETEEKEEEEEEEGEEEELGAMKEMMYKIAAMQPVDIDPSTIRKPKRRNVRISDDPQSVAARHRRERISEKMRILQRLVPGGTKMDTASMLDEAIRYVKFLKKQVRLLQSSNNQHIPPWQPPPLASTATSSSLESPAGLGFTFSGANRGDPAAFCFNHEVISD
ncbi:hypothetical protein JCGZ_19241 [Jatropha curcas]|uniref:BHLH domain-containing protein n=1 Tax=Jatropha curcas TaxID=180498 RepID=A0A067K383_JATCU|nr:transcription factor HEC3 [Jatropha curcas]KDP29528.1 hypothetical protein JCGZ_19241 [Jatropha curcas]